MEATRRQILKSVAAGLSLCLASSRQVANAAGPTPIRMAYAEKYGPLSTLAANGSANGLLVDAVNLVGHDCGLEFESAAYAWARAQLLLRQGDADGFCTVPTQERRGYALFCAAPFVVIRHGVFHRSDDLRPVQVHSIEDLRQFRQGNYRGNGYAAQYLEFDRNRLDNDAASVLRRIAMNDLDTFVEAEFPVANRLKEFGLTEQIRFTPLPFLPLADFCFGLRRSYPDAEAVVQKMEAAIKAAEKSGALSALRRRYGLRA